MTFFFEVFFEIDTQALLRRDFAMRVELKLLPANCIHMEYSSCESSMQCLLYVTPQNLFLIG